MSKKKGSKSLTASQEVFDAAREREKEIAGESTATDPAEVNDETAIAKPAAKHRERPKGLEVVSSGASYHKFEEEPVFEGNFVSKFLAPKDIPSNRTKKGDVIGFNFIDLATGKESIVSNSYSIQKALEEDGFNVNTKWWIEFEGKTIVKGKPFNRFFIAKSK